MTRFPAPSGLLTLSDQQRFDWVRLIRTEGIGPRTFRSLINHFGGASAALDGLPELARKRGGKAVAIPSRDQIAREFEAADRMSVRFVATGEAEYPAPLAAIDSAPPIIAVRGRRDALSRPMAALIGSRNASAGGRQMTLRLAQGLGRAGFGVVSGLARGIDAAAHLGSLETGTVAVLAGGHDRLYPAEHESLLADILEKGAVVSEMPMGWEPRGRDFPRRNRIVSGLSLGVVLVEAARKSGSLITARFALEQGREVFAVPGSPLDPRAEGTNDLIREGATLVRSVDDVIEVLAPLVGAQDPAGRFMRDDGKGEDEPPLWDELDLFGEETRPAPRSFNEDASTEPETGAIAIAGQDHQTMAMRIENLLGPSPVAVDELVRQSLLSVRDVQMALLDLDLAGRLDHHGGQLVSLRVPDPG